MTTNLYNTSEAATYLGLSKAFLERDRWAGAKIPYIQVGARAVRYRKEDLDSHIVSRIRKSTSDDGSRK